MRWFEAFEVMQRDGLVRLNHWEQDEYIYLTTDVAGDYELINQNEDVILLSNDSLESNQWEEYCTFKTKTLEELSDEELRDRVRDKLFTKLDFFVKCTNSRLRSFAIKHNALTDISDPYGTNYYISWCDKHERFVIESAYGCYAQGVVYFSDKEVCCMALQCHYSILSKTKRLHLIATDTWLGYSRELLLERNEEINKIIDIF